MHTRLVAIPLTTGMFCLAPRSSTIVVDQLRRAGWQARHVELTVMNCNVS